MATLARFSNFALRPKPEKQLVGEPPQTRHFGPRRRQLRYATSGQVGPKCAPLRLLRLFPTKQALRGPLCPKMCIRDRISLYRAAQATFRRILAGAKIPKMDTLKAEAARLAADKKTLYAEYRVARTDMRELMTVKANIDRLFGLTDGQKTKEMEQHQDVYKRQVLF